MNSGGRWNKLNSIERKIRKHRIYGQWVERNKSWACNKCDSKDDLELHHITQLYHIIFGAVKTFSVDDAIEHILSRHANDEVDCLTLCNNCHGQIHPNIENNHKPINFDKEFNYVVFPRKLDFEFQQGKKNPSDHKVNLLCLQILFGLGYYILNNNLNDNNILFNCRHLAKILGKTPGTSFKKSLQNSLIVLKNLKIIENSIEDGSNFTIKFSDEYLDKLEENPWFLSLKDIRCKKMTTITLKIFLSFQNKKVYKIGKDKISTHLGLTTTTPTYIKNTVKEASKEIAWTTCSFRNNVFEFKLNRIQIVPIYKLRTVLSRRLLYR